MNKQYFFIKQFCDNYSLVKQLYECPRNIANWASKLEQYMKTNAINKTGANPDTQKLVEQTTDSVTSKSTSLIKLSDNSRS
jgi:hypothetical protein